MAHLNYTVAMEGCEAADPHARFAFYADAQNFARAKSIKYNYVPWIVVLTIADQETLRLRFEDGKEVRS